MALNAGHHLGKERILDRLDTGLDPLETRVPLAKGGHNALSLNGGHEPTHDLPRAVLPATRSDSDGGRRTDRPAQGAPLGSE
jgi:hypothetical protein